MFPAGVREVPDGTRCEPSGWPFIGDRDLGPPVLRIESGPAAVPFRRAVSDRA